MDSITLIRFSIDSLLAVSVIICAVRMLKSSASAAHVRRIQELEGTIRELIREADAAGQNLQDSLDRRQRNLDRTLTELEALDAKNSKTITQAQDFIRTIDSSVSRAKSDLKDIAQTAQQIIQKTQNEVRFAQSESEKSFNPAPTKREVRDNNRIETVADEQSTISLDSMFDTTPEPPSFNRVTSTNKSPLREKIEIESEERDSDTDIAEIQRFANELLSAGRDIEFVAARTRLSVDEVKKLSGRNHSSSSPATTEEPQPTRDPRLGALGAMRRVTQTL